VIKAYHTAQLLAQELLNQAQENEPKITADLQEIADKVAAEMVGLEHKFKTQDSLAKKIVIITEKDSVETTQIGDKINDALRYTFIFAIEIYKERFHHTISALQEIGCQIPENKIWNAWKNIGTKFDRGYRGINITIISTQGQKFELQFHTKQSFGLKTENHHLYKESKSSETSSERKREIFRYMVNEAAKIIVPEGVK
jgi:hypothetical protein